MNYNKKTEYARSASHSIVFMSWMVKQAIIKLLKKIAAFLKSKTYFYNLDKS